MSINLKVRIMNATDLEECSGLMLKVFNRSPWFDKWNSVQHVQKYLKEFLNNPVFIGFVIEQNNKIIGACFGHTKSWYEGEEYYIDEYFVDSTLQHSGIGSKLLDYIKKYLVSKNIHCIVLLTEKNLPAEKFYKKHGFEVKSDNIFMYHVF
ncbi:MAG: GNAT family N-acetyltransferase [Virgibacillus proomii]|jgi:aminoglycoside 6'-N-acetyltransferase I